MAIIYLSIHLLYHGEHVEIVSKVISSYATATHIPAPVPTSSPFFPDCCHEGHSPSPDWVTAESQPASTEFGGIGFPVSASDPASSDEKVDWEQLLDAIDELLALAQRGEGFSEHVSYKQLGQYKGQVFRAERAWQLSNRGLLAQEQVEVGMAKVFQDLASFTNLDWPALSVALRAGDYSTISVSCPDTVGTTRPTPHGPVVPLKGHADAPPGSTKSAPNIWCFDRSLGLPHTLHIHPDAKVPFGCSPMLPIRGKGLLKDMESYSWDLRNQIKDLKDFLARLIRNSAEEMEIGRSDLLRLISFRLMSSIVREETKKQVRLDNLKLELLDILGPGVEDQYVFSTPEVTADAPPREHSEPAAIPTLESGLALKQTETTSKGHSGWTRCGLKIMPHTWRCPKRRSLPPKWMSYLVQPRPMAQGGFEWRTWRLQSAYRAVAAAGDEPGKGSRRAGSTLNDLRLKRMIEQQLA
ncbi:hypothetical protein CLAFUR0_06330 [Fulvia fulva]|nr:hypothetical protein CLAFUR0_06330 [Fulvia fulva]